MKKNKLSVSFLFNALLQSLNYIVPLITTPYISRILGAELLGEYSYYYSIISYFILFISFGFTNYGIKTIAAVKSDRKCVSDIFWQIFIAKILLGIISFIVYFILFATLWNNNDMQNIMLIFSLFIVGTIFDITYFFQALEEYKLITLKTLFIRIIFVVLTFILVKSKNDFTKYIYIQVFSTLISSIFMWISLYKKIQFKGVKIKKFHKHIIGALPFFLPSIAYLTYGLLDKTMIGLISTNVENGYYEQMTKLINLITISIGSISPIILSRISALVGKEDSIEEIEKTSKVAFKTVIGLAFPAILGLILIAQWMIPIVFGDEFIPATTCLYALLPLLLTTTLGWVIDAIYFTPYSKKKVFNFIIYGKSLLNIILNIFFIKYYGAFGAAIASSIADLVGLIFYIIYSRKIISYKNVVLYSIKFLFAGVSMFLIGFFTGKFLPFEPIINMIIIILESIVIYALFLIVSKEEIIWEYLNKVFKHRRKENVEES